MTNEDSAMKMVALAHEALRGRAYVDAATLIDSVIATNPDLADAYVVRAMVYMAPGNFSRAVEDLRKYVELAGEDANPWALERLARLEERGAKDDISAPGFFRKLGNYYYERGHYERAITEYTYWIDSRPSVAGYVNRAGAYLLLKRHDEAIADGNRALAHYGAPWSPGRHQRLSNVYCNRGLAYYGKGEYQQAAHDLTFAIKLSPQNDPVLYFNRGEIYRHLPDFEKAIADITRAIDLGLDKPKAFFELGMAYYGQGARAQALDNLRQYVDRAGVFASPEALDVIDKLEDDSAWG